LIFSRTDYMAIPNFLCKGFGLRVHLSILPE
jgi:hypothetical protein